MGRVPHGLWSQARSHFTTLVQDAALGLCLWRRRYLNKVVSTLHLYVYSTLTMNSTPRHHNYTVMLEEQVQQFLTYAQPTLSKFIDPSKTLVAFWIGINDINDSAKYAVDFPAFYDKLITTLFESVQSVYNVGYRSFLFMNLPPLDRTPGNVLKTAPLPNTTMINWWDETLALHIDIFNKQDSRANAFGFDVNGFLNGVLDHPDKYGIKNVTGYCKSYDQPYVATDPQQYGCLPLDEYAWFNNGHMTSRVHEILAKELAQFLKKQ